MNASASSRGMPSRWERPKAVRPYSTPKLNTFARRRISGVTASIGTPKTRAAVARVDVEAVARRLAAELVVAATCARARAARSASSRSDRSSGDSPQSLRDERAAHLRCRLGAHGDVLQVRVVRGEPAGGGGDLREDACGCAPCAGSTCRGSVSTYVDLIFVSSRQRSTASTTGWTSRSASRASASVV